MSGDLRADRPLIDARSLILRMSVAGRAATVIRSFLALQFLLFKGPEAHERVIDAGLSRELLQAARAGGVRLHCLSDVH